MEATAWRLTFEGLRDELVVVNLTAEEHMILFLRVALNCASRAIQASYNWRLGKYRRWKSG